MRKSLRKRRTYQGGTELIEFSLCMLLMFPLMMGMIIVGLNLGQSIRVAQICRDAGSMYVRGIDFSQKPNQDELIRLANGMGMTNTGGTGVVIFSKVQFIPASACTGIPNCNSDKYVVAQRLVVGKASLTTSRLGPAGALTTDGSGNVINYMTDANAVTSNFSSIMTLASSEFAYVAETFFDSLDLTSIGTPVGSGVYARSVY